MKKLLLLLSSLIIAFYTNATIITTIGSGHWDNTAVWSSGTVPGIADTVHILSGHTITVDDTDNGYYTIGVLQINTGGTLNVESNDIEVIYKVINNGTYNSDGHLIIGLLTVPFYSPANDSLSIEGAGLYNFTGDPMNDPGISFYSSTSFINTTNVNNVIENLYLDFGSLVLEMNNKITCNEIYANSDYYIQLNNADLVNHKIWFDATVITNGTGELITHQDGTETTIKYYLSNDTTLSKAYITLNNFTTAQQFAIRLQDGVYADGTSGTAITDYNLQFTYHLERQSGTGALDVTFAWDTAYEQPNFNRSSCAIAHYNGTSWDLGTMASANSDGFQYRHKTINGISSFSPFTVSSTGTPLPIQLISFECIYKNEQHFLDWEVSHLDDLADFTILSSKDGNSWITFRTISTNDMLHKYSTDITTAVDDGYIFYKLQLNYFNNKPNYSTVVTVNTNNKINKLNIYPNPAIEHINILSNTAQSVNCYDISGKLIRTIKIENGSQNFDISDWKNGIYILKTSDGISYKIIKK